MVQGGHHRRNRRRGLRVDELVHVQNSQPLALRPGHLDAVHEGLELALAPGKADVLDVGVLRVGLAAVVVKDVEVVDAHPPVVSDPVGHKLGSVPDLRHCAEAVLGPGGSFHERSVQIRC